MRSVEAELYAMVAASAEALAIAAYLRYLGLDLAVEIYCDSAAALGITNRAGFGKVRHLRKQGLWIQELSCLCNAVSVKHEALKRNVVFRNADCISMKRGCVSHCASVFLKRGCVSRKRGFVETRGL